MAIFSKLITLATLALLLVALPILGRSLPGQVDGAGMARELYDYLNGGGLFHVASLIKTIYLLIILSIGFFSIVLLRANSKALSELGKVKSLPTFELLVLSAPFFVYFLLSESKLRDQHILYIFIEIGLAAIVTAVQNNKAAQLKANTNTPQVLFGIVCLLLVSPFIKHFGLIPVLEPVDFIFSADIHLGQLVGPAVRLIDGYSWLSGVQPNYGLLMPELMSHFFNKTSFSIEKSIILLQCLQVTLVTLMITSSYFRFKNFICMALLLPTLYLFDPSILQIFTPNHGGWRYMGLALAFFALSLGCWTRSRLNPLIKGAIGAVSLLVNFETGLVITTAIIGSVIFDQKNQLRRTLTVVVSAAVFFLTSVSFITDRIPGDFLHQLYSAGLFNNEWGGTLFNAIPVFVLIVLHCAVIVWRTAQSKIRFPSQDFDLVAALYCLGWSMYFVNRSNDTYLMTIFIVYSFLLMRLSSDVHWLVGNKTKMLSYGFVYLCLFSYFTFYVGQFVHFYSWMNVRHLEVKNIRKMEGLRNVNSSALELSRFKGAEDGYITPFSFYVRGVTGLSNNLSVQDPFSSLLREREVTSFLAGKLPATLFLPKSESLFSPSDPPAPYLRFIGRVSSSLKARGYSVRRELQYWTVYIKSQKTN